MSILNDIRGALDTRLLATAGIPAVAPQNVLYNPTTGVAFLKSTLVPNTVRPAVRGPNPQKRYDGLYSILICTPEGQGAGAGYDLADLLLDRFVATTDISFAGIIVSVEYSEVGNSYFSPPFYCTPVTIAWYIYN
jgi:hypothetical protein